jgi:hypothetical protein
VVRDGEPVAAGTAAGPELMHLAIRPDVEDAALPVLTTLAGLSPGGSVCLPAPHPAVRALLAAGWRIGYLDLFMESEPGLLDPRRAVPSPGQA